jgi:hypothetical protein
MHSESWSYDGGVADQQLLGRLRRLHQTNRTFSTFWRWYVVLFAGATLYLLAVGSWYFLFTLVMAVFSFCTLAAGALYGKGTPRNAARALIALAARRYGASG